MTAPAQVAPVMSGEHADWVQHNVLPPMWRHSDAAEEIRTCVCQAPPSQWLGGIAEPAARLWNSAGYPVAWSRDGRHGRYVAGLAVLWEVGRTCRRRSPAAPATP